MWPSPSARNIASRCGHAKNPYRHCSAATVATVHNSLSTPETGTLDSRRHRGPLSALSSFEQALKGALTGRIRLPALGGHEFIAVVTDLTWALLQKVANDGTRLAHHLEVEQFPVPPGWRAPIMLHTLSRVDLSFRQAILATIACLLLPKYFAAMASTSSHLQPPRPPRRLLPPAAHPRSRTSRCPARSRLEMATLFPNAHDASQVRAPSSPLRSAAHTSMSVY